MRSGRGVAFADSRIFFDELVSIGVSRLRATGAIRLEDRQKVIAFGDKWLKLRVGCPVQTYRASKSSFHSS